jgi:site-specific recombinase XerC
MVYTFARINAALEMKVRDYFVQGRRGWVRLHEKGGKQHEFPCHHNLEKYLDQYITAAKIADDPDGPLFRTAAGKSGKLTRQRQVAAGRLPHDPAPRGRRRHQDPHRLPHLPCDRHHLLVLRTRAPSKLPSSSPITSRPATPNSMIGGRMRFH